MKTDTIKAIFTNLLFVIGIVLLIFGFVRATLTITRSLVFDDYPLDSWEETRCQTEIFAQPALAEKTDSQPITDEDLEIRRLKCQDTLEHRRDVKQVEDIATSISTLVAGIAITLVFKRFIFNQS